MVLVFLLMYSLGAAAQDSLRWDEFIEKYADEEQDDNADWEDMYELLTDIHEHPMNINTATRDELGRLPFLNAEQIEEIQAYVYDYGSMKSLNELLMIESLDYETRCRLMHFVYAGELPSKGFPDAKTIRKYGKNELFLSASIPFYDHRGDENGYLGYKYKHSLRYDFSYGDDIRFGITAKQDAGEPFFSNKNGLGYDHYSYYFVLRRLGMLKTLAVGDYRASFGLGLVVNSGFSMGKMMSLSSLGRPNRGFTANSSTSEGNYFQGVAATVQMTEGLNVSGFVSYRKIDATLNPDSTAATIITTGYHRTESELDKKHNTSMANAGINVAYQYKDMHVGLTAVYTHLDRQLVPDDVLYKWYYPRGREFVNASTDYGCVNRYFTFNGETAINDSLHIASLNCLNLHVTSNFDIMSIYRFYSYRYSSLLARSFSEAGRVQNESGLYLGFNWKPKWEWTVMAYTDWFRFAWPRYMVSKPSDGCDNYLSVSYNGKRHSFDIRYRLRSKQKDNEDKTGLTRTIQQKAKLRYALNANRHVELMTQLDLTDMKTDRHEYGYMLSENISYHTSKTVSADLMMGYFRTDSYASGVTAYERGLLYSFSFPTFSGKGLRGMLATRVTLSDHIMLIAKAGCTHYMDRNEMGSGLQLIKGNTKTDMDMQLRIRF